MSIAYEWSRQPSELRARDYDRVYKIRASAAAINQLLPHVGDWQTIPLERLFGLDSPLAARGCAEGFSKQNQNRYARGCRKILEHEIARGWTCAALDKLATWNDVFAALGGRPRGLVRMIEDIGMQMTTFETTENDLESARQRAVDRGLAESTTLALVSSFRTEMRAAGLQHLFPLLDFEPKRKPYCDSLADMTIKAQKQLYTLVAFRAPGVVPGRAAKDATRPAAAGRMVLSFRELHGHTRDKEGRTPPTLRELVAPENVLPWIDYLQHVRGLLRTSVEANVGPIHSIVSCHEIFSGLNFDWMLDRIRAVPKERAYKVQERKQDMSVPDQVLAGLPQLIRSTSRAPGLSPKEVAWLRHDEALVRFLLLALRQRNIRECCMRVNLKPGTINYKMAHELDLPDCVRAAWNDDHSREFLTLVYTEPQTKTNHAETVFIPIADAEVIERFIGFHRKSIVSKKHKHRNVFCNRRGEKLTSKTFRDLVKGITQTHLGKAITPHIWRSIFGSRVLRLAALGIGGGLKHAQRALFHRKERTTQPYLNLNYAVPGVVAINRIFPPYPVDDRQENSAGIS
jgi:hypothetical protein